MMRLKPFTMKSVSTIFILAVALLLNCTNQEEVSPSTSALENDKTLLGAIETPQGHRVSFHEYAPGSLGTLATYPIDSNDEFSMQIQTLLGSGLSAAEVYKQLAKNNINEQYLQSITAAVARLAALRIKQKGVEAGKELQPKTMESAAQRALITFPPLPWCPFSLEYAQIKCKDGNLVTWYPAVKKNFRVRLYIYAATGGGYLRVDRRNCGFEYCDPGVAVFDLTKFNTRSGEIIDFVLENATPDSYYFRGQGFSTATKSGSKIHLGVGVDKINL